MAKPSKPVPGDPYGSHFKESISTHLPVAHVTGTQLDTIRSALEHPKAQPDRTLTVLAIMNAVASFLGILKGIKPTTNPVWVSVVDFIVLLVTFGNSWVILNEYRRRKTEVDYQQIQALKYVEALMLQEAATRAKMEAAYAREEALLLPPPPPPSGLGPTQQLPGPMTPVAPTQPSAAGPQPPKSPTT